MTQTYQLRVFYDGGCSICRLEVDLYDRHDEAGHIDWIDIETLTDLQLPIRKSRAQLFGKFHVQEVYNQNWHIGVDALARIWEALPVWRRFAFIFFLPGIRQLAEIGYRSFLRWQRWHRNKRTRNEKAIAD